jgi:hypothetical protein
MLWGIGAGTGLFKGSTLNCLAYIYFKWNLSTELITVQSTKMFLDSLIPKDPEHIISPGSHVEYSTGKKNRNVVEDHPMNIPAKFGSNWPSGFGEEASNVKRY